MNPMQILWLVLLVVFLCMEAATVSLVTSWFACGALVALVASLLGAQIWLQIVLFIVVSAFLLCALRPFVKKVLKPRQVATNVDALIGAEGLVTADICNLQETGKVKLSGMEWTARSTEEKTICEGARIRVDRISGVKVYVTEIPVMAEK